MFVGDIELERTTRSISFYPGHTSCNYICQILSKLFLYFQPNEFNLIFSLFGMFQIHFEGLVKWDNWLKLGKYI